MAEKLVEYYAYAQRKGGLVLQMKLAMKTCLSEPKAAARPDTPETVRRFHEALLDLVGPDPDLPKP